MSNWSELVLGDIADIISEKTDISLATPETYISTDNMHSNFGGVSAAEKLPTVSNINTFKISDVLFSNIRTYFKKVWLSTFSGTVSPDVLVFRSKTKGICNEVYLYYLLCNPVFTEYSVLTSRGAKMPRGDKDALLKYGFLLPPLPEQKAIAAVLSSLDDKIDLLHRQNKTLEAMAETLFRKWFVEDAGDDWEECLLGDIAVFSNGKKRPNTEGCIPVYGGNGILSYTNESNYNGPIVVIGRVGAYCGSIYFEDKSIWVSDNALSAFSHKPEYIYFLFYLLKYLNLNEMAEGSSHPLLTQSLLKSIDLKLPKEQIVQKFSKIAKSYLRKIAGNKFQINKLEKLRDVLLPKLMSGEVRVEY